MGTKVRFLVESYLTFILLFLVASLITNRIEVLELGEGVYAFAKATLLIGIHVVLKVPRISLMRAALLGVCIGMLDWVRVGWSQEHLQATMTFIVWSLSVGRFYTLYQTRSQCRNLGFVNLTVDNNKVGVSIPNSGVVEWFSPERISAAHNYVHDKTGKSCTSVRYEYSSHGTVPLEQLRSFGNSLISVKLQHR